MSSVVPEGWEVHALGELGQVVGGGTPASDTPNYWGGSVMWATPGEITKLKNRYITNTVRTITEEGLQSSSAKLHPAGTILLTSRASIGYPAISKVPMATNQGFQSLQPNEKLDVEYGYQLLLNNRGGLERLSAGSTFLEISSKEINKYKLPIPPLPEQKKIASILTSVDEVIENTQKQIDKHQYHKNATMN
jgi:type I restriction enzyme S subunit